MLGELLLGRDCFRGTYIIDYQLLPNNRVRKNAHTIVCFWLNISLVGATSVVMPRSVYPVLPLISMSF